MSGDRSACHRHKPAELPSDRTITCQAARRHHRLVFMTATGASPWRTMVELFPCRNHDSTARFVLPRPAATSPVAAPARHGHQPAARYPDHLIICQATDRHHQQLFVAATGTDFSGARWCSFFPAATTMVMPDSSYHMPHPAATSPATAPARHGHQPAELSPDRTIICSATRRHHRQLFVAATGTDFPGVLFYSFFPAAITMMVHYASYDTLPRPVR